MQYKLNTNTTKLIVKTRPKQLLGYVLFDISLSGEIDLIFKLNFLLNFEQDSVFILVKYLWARLERTQSGAPKGLTLK
jgi:hypothetical protein